MKKQIIQWLQKWLRPAAIAVAVLFLLAYIPLQLSAWFPQWGFPTVEDIMVAMRLSPSPATPVDMLEIHVINVGNADCILLRQSNKSLLIDAGEQGNSDEIMRYFRRHNIDCLDMLLLTHAHADHAGAAARIIRDMPVAQLAYMPAPLADKDASQAFYNALSMADERHTALVTIEAGMQLMLGDATVQILAPLQNTSVANNMSVVCLITFGENRFLLMGDTENAAEQQLLSAYPSLQADWLKVAHHGGDTATSERFLQCVSPQYAVITCGYHNTHDHPSAAVLQRLDAVGATVCRSDIHGHMRFLCNGNKIILAEYGYE